MHVYGELQVTVVDVVVSLLTHLAGGFEFECL